MVQTGRLAAKGDAYGTPYPPNMHEHVRFLGCVAVRVEEIDRVVGCWHQSSKHAVRTRARSDGARGE